MQTVERNGSFFRFRLSLFDPAESGGPSQLLVERELIFGSTAAAVMFLRPFAGDAFAVRGLQQVLSGLGEPASVHEAGDEWIDRLAVHLASGRVVVAEQTRRNPAGDSNDTGGGGAASTARASAPVTAPRQAPEKPPPPAEAATFPPTADTLAQVQALKKAAQDGVPFCEECAKAAAAQRNLSSV